MVSSTSPFMRDVAQRQQTPWPGSMCNPWPVSGHGRNVYDYRMQTDELDFQLPPELIAQAPPERRTDSRLLRYCRADLSISHHTFSDLPSLLRPGDLLVFN